MSVQRGKAKNTHRPTDKITSKERIHIKIYHFGICNIKKFFQKICNSLLTNAEKYDILLPSSQDKMNTRKQRTANGLTADIYNAVNGDGLTAFCRYSVAH